MIGVVLITVFYGELVFTINRIITVLFNRFFSDWVFDDYFKILHKRVFLLQLKFIAQVGVAMSVAGLWIWEYATIYRISISF